MKNTIILIISYIGIMIAATLICVVCSFLSVRVALYYNLDGLWILPIMIIFITFIAIVLTIMVLLLVYMNTKQKISMIKIKNSKIYLCNRG